MVLKLTSKRDAWRAILRASRIYDHDYHKADRMFEQYQCERQHGPKPGPWDGGELDEVNEALGFKVSGPLEGFFALTRDAKEWQDLIGAISILRQVPGLESLRLPDDAIEEINSQVEYWHNIELALVAA